MLSHDREVCSNFVYYSWCSDSAVVTNLYNGTLKGWKLEACACTREVACRAAISNTRITKSCVELTMLIYHHLRSGAVVSTCTFHAPQVMADEGSEAGCETPQAATAVRVVKSEPALESSCCAGARQTTDSSSGCSKPCG